MSNDAFVLVADLDLVKCARVHWCLVLCRFKHDQLFVHVT